MITLIISGAYAAIIIIGVITALKRLDFSEIKYNLMRSNPVKPMVSIIIPARNEENNIANCIDSLISLEYPNFEIILVDGNSTDKTVAFASEYKSVKIIKEPPLPQNWVGKPWACHIGAQEAKGEVLLFTDADTIHRKDSLNKSISILEESNGFVSMVTTQIFTTFWEHLLTIVFLMISITVNGTKGNSKAQIANGQYMLFTRATYNKIGGHKIVFDSIVEDLAIGTLASNLGFKPTIIIDHNLVKARMYRNLSDIFDGFSKNLGLGMRQVGFSSLIFAGIINLWGTGFMFIVPLNYVIFGEVSTIVWGISLIGYISFLSLIYVGETKVSEKGTFNTLFYPLYFLVFWIIVVNSSFQTFFSKKVKWKDRVYPIGN
ncbi:MAG: glycosyltransferase [Candidatus Kariarchaeaceae archaeon]|jgi:chlorobactene glucosyltransferase